MIHEKNRLYHFFVMLPEYLYPLGPRHYERVLRRAFKKYGVGYYGWGLTFYRQIFHLVGSLLVMFVATYIALDLFGSRGALIVALALVTVAITYQEFYYQRKHYKQHWQKACADWAVWITPILVYCLFVLY